MTLNDRSASLLAGADGGTESEHVGNNSKHT